MFRTAKPRTNAPSGPRIWSEDRQFAPFEFGAWTRVSGILARRAAAGCLGRLSNGSANLAIGLEEGRWKINFAALGWAAAVIPSRLSVARNLARLSRLQAMSAKLVDHRSEGIAPLEIQDLSAFMHGRRLAAQQAEAVRKAEEDRKAVAARRLSGVSNSGLVRPVRKLGTAADDPLHALPQLMAEPQPNPNPGLSQIVAESDAGSPALMVSTDELLAIRMAIASAPPPAPTMVYPGAIAAEPVAKPAPRNVFSGANTTWYDQNPSDEADLAEPVHLPKAKSRIGSLLRRLGRSLLSLIGRGLLALWRPIKDRVANLFAAVLGWTAVTIALPYGAVNAALLHARNVDLRYFD